MKSKIVGFLVALFLGTTLAWALTQTTGLGIPLTNDATLNSALNKIDANLTRVVRDRGYNLQIFCGDLANAAAIYFGPGDVSTARGTYTDLHIGGTACSALDGTEGGVDAPIYTNVPIAVHGMQCMIGAPVASAVVFSVRSAVAELSPPITCTVAVGATDCYVGTGTAAGSTVGAGATMAVKAVTTTDLSASDGWCQVMYSMKLT